MSALAAEYPTSERIRSSSKRAAYFGRAALAFGMAAVTTETVVSRLAWRDNHTEITDEGSNVVLFGGLGIENSLEMASSLGQFSESQIESVKYSSNGLSPESIGNALARRYRTNQQEQELLVHSLGLNLFLKGVEALVLKNRGLEREGRQEEVVRIPEISKIIAISSPLSIEDTYMGPRVQKMLHIGYSGGLLSRAAVKCANSIRETDSSISSVGKAVLGAAISPLAGESAYTYMGKLRMLAGPPCQDGILDGLLTSRTDIRYIGDAAGDRVVKVNSSTENIDKRIVRPYRCNFEIVDTPGFGHANVEDFADNIIELLVA